jgi:hypothetical protein
VTADDIEGEVADAYARYLEAFHSHVATQMAPHVRAPLSMISAGQMRMLDGGASEEMFRQTMIDLAKRDYSHTVMDRTAVTVLDASTALVQVEGSRLDSAGRSLEPIAAAYVYVRTSGAWQIAVMIPLASIDRASLN